MKVWLLRIDSMGGSGGFTGIAYLDKETAQVIAKAKHEEWTSYIPEEYEAEEIKGDRVIVGNEVYRLNRIVGAQAVKDGAMKKLNAREREVLGLK